MANFIGLLTFVGIVGGYLYTLSPMVGNIGRFFGIGQAVEVEGQSIMPVRFDNPEQAVRIAQETPTLVRYEAEVTATPTNIPTSTMAVYRYTATPTTTLQVGLPYWIETPTPIPFYRLTPTKEPSPTVPPPTATQVPQPTATQGYVVVLPTHTPQPTATQVPQPTATQVPPSPTVPPPTATQVPTATPDIIEVPVVTYLPSPVVAVIYLPLVVR